MYPFFSQYHTFSLTPERATTLTASPNASARPTRPTLCAYSSGRSGRVALITNGRPATSKPRAATSVHTRIRAAPSLNARRFSRRSAVDRDAPSTAHEYSLCGPLSRAAPPEPRAGTAPGRAKERLEEVAVVVRAAEHQTLLRRERVQEV